MGEGVNNVENSVPVSINLTTLITQSDGSKEELTLTSTGEWITKNNINYLKYEEKQEQGIVRTIVKMEQNQAVILRSGAVKMRLAFCEGKTMMGSYESEHGTLSLMTDTIKYIHRTPEKDAGCFHVSYDLVMAENHVGSYAMTIDFKEAT